MNVQSNLSQIYQCNCFGLLVTDNEGKTFICWQGYEPKVVFLLPLSYRVFCIVSLFAYRFPFLFSLLGLIFPKGLPIKIIKLPQDKIL
jgi:hypothetical protein